MAIAGCLFRCSKAAFYAIKGDSDQVNKGLDKGIEALRRPPMSELGDALLELFD